MKNEADSCAQMFVFGFRPLKTVRHYEHHEVSEIGRRSGRAFNSFEDDNPSVRSEMMLCFGEDFNTLSIIIPGRPAAVEEKKSP